MVRGTDFDRIASSTAVNSSASRVVSKGENWQLQKQINGKWSKDPMPFERATDFHRSQLSKRYMGQGFDPCKLEVLGIISKKTDGKKLRWVCRCVCGNYCAYPVSALRGFIKSKRGGPAKLIPKRVECPECAYSTELRNKAPVGKGAKPPGVQYLDKNEISLVLDRKCKDFASNRFKGRSIGRLKVLGPSRYHVELNERPAGKSIVQCECGSVFFAMRKTLAKGWLLECKSCRTDRDPFPNKEVAQVAEFGLWNLETRRVFLEAEFVLLSEEKTRLTKRLGRATAQDRDELSKIMRWLESINGFLDELEGYQKPVVARR